MPPSRHTHPHSGAKQNAAKTPKSRFMQIGLHTTNHAITLYTNPALFQPHLLDISRVIVYVVPGAFGRRRERLRVAWIWRWPFGMGWAWLHGGVRGMGGGPMAGLGCWVSTLYAT
jgi:hypothetical protein